MSGAGTAGGNGAGTGSGSKNLSHILLGIGIVMTVAAFAVPALTAGGTAAMGALLKGLILPVAGGGCMYFAGKTSATETRIGIGSTKNAGSGSAGAPAQRIEITIDPEKLWSSLRGAVMVIDRNLEIAGEEEKYALQKELSAAVGAKGISAEEIELFSGLLEMADADSPQMAADIRYYLHKKNVDVLTWSVQNAAWFEMLPSIPGRTAGSKSDSAKEDAVMTIRPALAQDGKLLKKGTAVR